jgi:hypothetical protein
MDPGDHSIEDRAMRGFLRYGCIFKEAGNHNRYRERSVMGWLSRLGFEARAPRFPVTTARFKIKVLGTFAMYYPEQEPATAISS